jgi:hypothetical protein
MCALHFAIREVSIVATADSAGRVIPRSPLQPFAWREELFDLQSSDARNRRRESLELLLGRHRARCRDMLSVVLAGPLAAARFIMSDKPYKDDSDKQHLAFLLSELGTTSEPQLTLQFEQAKSRADSILDEHWECINLIAAELCRRKSLSGSAVRRMLKQRDELMKRSHLDIDKSCESAPK